MYFDAHTHVHFAAFEKDSKEVISRALATGVWMVIVGTQKDTSRRAVEATREYKEGVYAAVGIHPVHTAKSYHDENELGGGEAAKAFTSRGEEFDHDYYLELARDSKVVAIGECGLDYYRLRVPTDADLTQTDAEETKERQKKAFIKQVELAHEVQKPLMIHCRSAFSDLIEILQTYYGLKSRRSGRDSDSANRRTSELKAEAPGIVHFFSGTMEDAQKLLNMGFAFTFGGAITFPPRKQSRVVAEGDSTRGKTEGDYDEIIKMLPMDRILSETDAPYVSPAPYRGKRNEPAYVVEVVKKLAELKGVSFEEMAKSTFENARRIFRV